MEVKCLEIRDKRTFIAVLAVDMNPILWSSDGGAGPGERQRYLLRRCGYPCDGVPNVIVTRLDGSGTHAFNDCYQHGDRTWRVAHEWIIDHWKELSDGDVVDVEFILGEKPEPKISERFEHA